MESTRENLVLACLNGSPPGAPQRSSTDAETIREYYRKRFRQVSTFIPYGAETGKVQACDQVRALGLEPGRYVLYVSRMEPENNALLVRQAFESVKTDSNSRLSAMRPMPIPTSLRSKRPATLASSSPGAIYGEGYRSYSRTAPLTCRPPRSAAPTRL